MSGPIFPRISPLRKLLVPSSMSELSALLQRMGSEQIDLKRQIVAAFGDNPFLDAEIESLSARFSTPTELLARVLDDLCSREVLVQSGWGGIGLSPSPEVYPSAVALASETDRGGAPSRKQIFEMETAERLKGQLAVSQREVEAILDIVPAGVLIFDRNRHLLKSNRAAWEILGLGAGNREEGRALEALGLQEPGEGDPGPFLSELLLRGGESRWELERTPPVEVVARPFSVGAKMSGLILTVRDISDRRAAEEAGARLREDFFSMIRHELLKPLLGIERALGSFGNAGWLEDAERDSLLDNARGGMRRLKAMIDDMLLLARLERDPMAVNVGEHILLTLLLTSASLSFREPAERLDLTLKAEIPDEDIEFPGDEKRVLQVLENLLDNALKFTPPGGTVVLSGKRVQGTASGETWVEIAVADSGIGIPPDEQGRIFGKFYQVQKGPDRREGLGLGLAICERIVAAHAGRIAIESKPGHGTTVRVLFPAASPRHGIG